MKRGTVPLLWMTALIAAIGATIYLVTDQATGYGDRRSWIRSADGSMIRRDFISSAGYYCGELGHDTSGFLRFYGVTASSVAYEDEPSFNLTEYSKNCGVVLSSDDGATERSRVAAKDAAAAAPHRSEGNAQQARWLRENEQALRALHEASARAMQDEAETRYDRTSTGNASSVLAK